MFTVLNVMFVLVLGMLAFVPMNTAQAVTDEIECGPAFIGNEGCGAIIKGCDYAFGDLPG